GLSVRELQPPISVPGHRFLLIKAKTSPMRKARNSGKARIISGFPRKNVSDWLHQKHIRRLATFMYLAR
ncbi:MAG: hypothetical protein K6E59_04925, partial [Bacilli bacterium]|nr:hypothetical protein [Bacilli bacterium]